MRRLEFLPYHFLLTSIGEGGVLRYQARARQALACVHAPRLGCRVGLAAHDRCHRSCPSKV